MHVGRRTGSLLAAPPRWSKQTNTQGRGKGRWKVIAVPAADVWGGGASVGRAFPGLLELGEAHVQIPDAAFECHSEMMNVRVRLNPPPRQRERALNSRLGLRGSLAVLLIVSLIRRVPKTKENKLSKQK